MRREGVYQALLHEHQIPKVGSFVDSLLAEPKSDLGAPLYPDLILGSRSLGLARILRYKPITSMVTISVNFSGLDV